MRFSVAIGQSWKGVAGAALAAVMLSAVAATGLTLLGPDVLALWKAPENAEQVLALSQEPLTFEAPASTLARSQAKEKDAQIGKDGVETAALLVKDWKNTSASLAEFQAFQRQLMLFEIWLNVTLLQNGLDQDNFMNFVIFEFFLNRELAAFAPPASPSS